MANDMEKWHYKSNGSRVCQNIKISKVSKSNLSVRYLGEYMNNSNLQKNLYYLKLIKEKCHKHEKKNLAHPTTKLLTEWLFNSMLNTWPAQRGNASLLIAADPDFGRLLTLVGVSNVVVHPETLLTQWSYM